MTTTLGRRCNVVGESHLFIVSRNAPDVAHFLIEQFPPESCWIAVMESAARVPAFISSSDRAPPASSKRFYAALFLLRP